MLSKKVCGVVLSPEGSLWWERFLKEVALKPGVKQKLSYRW